MRKIKLTHGKFSLIDDDVFYQSWFCNYKWYARKAHGGFYACRTGKDNGKSYVKYLHRAIVNCPKGYEVHHINGNTLDNQRINLLILTPQAHLELHQKLSLVDRA